MGRITGLAALVLLILATALPQELSAQKSYPQLTNLPTLYIETEDAAQITSKENYIRASLIYVDGDETVEYQDKLGIRGRGNSTWGLAKKPYRIKFDSKTEFLGSDRAKAKSWTLLANHADKTLMRNAVAACIGAFAGQPFTAAVRFVDVVLNGQYQGNYQISDQIEIRKKRVNITEQAEQATSQSNISGGYLLEVDGFATGEPVWFWTSRGVQITVKSPDEEVINKEQIEYIRNHYKKFEDALFAPNFTDPSYGYRRYVDASTLASWYISTELTGNVDGFWSTYMYKEKDDDRFYWGPLWDYDIAFNNCVRKGDMVHKLMADDGFGNTLTMKWVNRMWEDPWFARLINDKWLELLDKGLEKHVLDYIDNTALSLEQSQQLNFDIWPLGQRVYDELVLFDTYAEGVDYLKWFVSEHIDYLTKAFAARVSGSTPIIPVEEFDYDPGYTYRFVNKGTSLTVTVGDDGFVCMAANNPDDESQEWELKPADGGYYLINRATGKAITDMSSYGWGGYNPGSQLQTYNQEDGDDSQIWNIKPVEGQSYYVLESQKTLLAWNNSGGGISDGTPVVSWYNDSQNPDKPNRLWQVSRGMKAGSGIELPETRDYCVTYCRESRELHFNFRDNAPAQGKVTVTAIDGRQLLAAPIAPTVSLSGLSSDIVIVSWVAGGHTHTVKLPL